MIRTNMAARPKHTKFLGVRTQHRWVELYFLDQILTQNTFDSIIEIGTAAGGLSTLLALHAHRTGARSVTFDIRREPTHLIWKEVTRKFMSFHQLDIYSDEALKIMDSYIQDGRVFLYCDGGVKKKAFNLFAPKLKENDIIMAHDRGTEIRLNDIAETIETCGLEPFHADEINKLGGKIFTFRKTI